jgi:hypothetical protein
MMMAANNKPYDAEIEYLESTGTQFIDLPLVVNVGQSLSFEGEMIPKDKNSGSGNHYVFASAPLNQFSGWNYSKNSTINIITYASYSGAVSAYGAWGCGTVVGVKGNFKVSTQGVTDPNTGVYSEVLRPLKNNIHNFYLFGNYSGNRSPIGYGKLWIKVDNIIVYELVPVRVGNIGYLYDKKSGKLFGNSGTGDFILGNDVN